MKYDILMLLLLILLLASSSLTEKDYEIYDEEEYEEENEEWRPSRDWKHQIERDVLPKGKMAPFNATERISVQLLFSTFDNFVLDEIDQILNVHGRFCLIWNDQRLLWNPVDYGGINNLHISTEDIWVPVFKTSSSMKLPSHFEQRKEPVHIYVFDSVRTPLVYVISCPRFTVKTGCALDMSDFPYDRHVCSFLVAPIQWQNIDLRVNNSITEQSEIRHILTRNETRTTIGAFTVLSINSTTKWSDGYNLFNSSTASTKPLIPIALQMIVFQRHYSNFFATFAVPSLFFAALNVTAVILTRMEQSIFIFLLNICLIGHFFRDAMPRFPLYFSKTPAIVRYITTSFCLASFAVFYLIMREVIFRNYGKRTVLEKLQNTGNDGMWKDFLLKKILSFEFAMILVSSLTTVWYIL